MSYYIKLSDIRIPDQFKKSSPLQNKIEAARKYFDEYGKFDKPIVINKDNILMDGYIRFLLALELNMDCIEVEYYNPDFLNEYAYPTNSKYIRGKFDDYNKEYIWRANWNQNIDVGDRVTVITLRKLSDKDYMICKRVVTVTEVFKARYDFNHKSVIRIVKKNK